jgi:cell division protein FtsX
MPQKESLNAVRKRLLEEQRKRTALKIGELMLAEREQQHQGEDEDIDRDDECMRQLKAIRDLLETLTWRVNIVLLLIFFVLLVHLFPRRLS